MPDETDKFEVTNRTRFFSSVKRNSMIMMAANLFVVVNMQRFDHLRIPKE